MGGEWDERGKKLLWDPIFKKIAVFYWCFGKGVRIVLAEIKAKIAVIQPSRDQ